MLVLVFLASIGLIIESVGLLEFPIVFEYAIWNLLMVATLPYLVYAIRLQFNFSSQVKLFYKKGIPMDSTEGFKYTKNAIKRNFTWTIILSLVVLISIVLHWLSSDTEIVADVLEYISISLLLFYLAVLLKLDIPATALLRPGNFLNYHTPDFFPTYLDNILQDSLLTFLDPRTRYQYDDWVIDITNKLHPEFESDEQDQIRIERAVERILLLLYLQNKIPDILSAETLKSHLLQVIDPGNYDNFISGKDSDMSIDVFEDILDILVDDVPEVFLLVDRLLIEIMVNPTAFDFSHTFIEVIIPEHVVEVRKPFKVLAYVLNLREEGDQRVVTVRADTSTQMEPRNTTIQIPLDESEEKIKELINRQKRLNGELVYSNRIIEILTYMLQVGDAVWLQFIPMNYGNHILNLSIQENSVHTYGTTTSIKVRLSIKNTLRKHGSKLSGIGGLIVPLVRYVFF
ncbi:MAG: hypothetical protein OEY49_16760 [Candidatus Heimdallarchaeota archaeon]|nr:hypothetical protein [Candidatus Heimdallarchaeota archaeon]